MVFGELRGAAHASPTQVILGSLVMAAGALVIALSSVSPREHAQWARGAAAATLRRTWVDWLIVGTATAIIAGFGVMARAPQIAVTWGWVTVLAALMLTMLVVAGLALWRTTRFS